MYIDENNYIEEIKFKTNKNNQNCEFNSYGFRSEVIKHAESQFNVKNYFEAVNESCKAFEKHVIEKSKLSLIGKSLMSNAFNIDKGTLQLTTKPLTETVRNLQGLMYLCMGLVQGVRNPTAHEPKLDYNIDKQVALELLGFINYLYKQVDKCTYIKENHMRQRISS